jgi:hypothetical protein
LDYASFSLFVLAVSIVSMLIITMSVMVIVAIIAVAVAVPMSVPIPMIVIIIVIIATTTGRWWRWVIRTAVIASTFVAVFIFSECGRSSGRRQSTARRI